MSQPDVVVVGAGLAGLSCARSLEAEGVHFTLRGRIDLKTYGWPTP